MRDIWARRFACLLAGGFLGVEMMEKLRLLFFLILLLLGVRLWFWRPRDFFGQLRKPEILILAVGFGVGVLYGYTGNSQLEKPLILNRVQVSGVLQDWNKSSDSATGVFLVKDVDFGAEESTSLDRSAGIKGKTYRLRVYPDRSGNFPENWSRALPGDELKFQARLEHPKPPGTIGQFDLPLYYAVRGQAGILTAQGDAEFLSIGQTPYSWQIRERVRQLLELWPIEKTSVLTGILFGDSSQIPQDELERYKITGVLHVFSASGSNVAFVLIIFWGVLRFLPISLRVILTCSTLIFYAILCGGNPPIVRATLMGVLALIGRLGRGNVNSLRNLLLAGVMLFLWQPLILRDTGFQLSFLATWGILVLAPRLSQQKSLRKLPHLLRFALATTLSAQLATLPIMITAFHRLSLVGLFANLAVLSVLGSVFELGLIGVLLSFSPALAVPLFQVSLWLLDGVNALLHVFAQLPGADVWVLNPGILFWLVWYGGILIFLAGQDLSLFILKAGLRSLIFKMNPSCWDFGTLKVGAEKGRNYVGIALVKIRSKFPKTAICIGKNQEIIFRVLGVVILIILFWSPWNIRKEVSISFIDVGQGDSILVETPKHHAILIDTGPKSERFDAGERIVLPYLLEKRIKHLDALILTHPHEDHVGGALSVLNNIPVDWVGVPDDGHNWGDSAQAKRGLFTQDGGRSSSAESSFADPLAEKLSQTKINPLRAGDRIVLDTDLTAEVVGPGEILTDTHSDPNNNSIVLKIEYGGQSVLLSGDMETEEMEDIVQSGLDWTSDYFKEPHHGSRFSLNMDYLDAISPKAVFISVGRNSFGHPSPKVLQYWEERHIPIYRTDEQGTIELRLDNRGETSLELGR